MESFFNLSSQHNAAATVIQDIVQQLAKAPTEANFGFIYVTDAMAENFSELIQQCKQTTGIQHWIGTIGLGIIAPNTELYDAPAVSIMLANFDENEFAMIPSINKSENIISHLNWPRTFASNFGIIHGDPFNEETQNMIEVLQKELENGFVVGGITSAKNKHYQVSNEVVHGGISGALFSENIGVITNLSQGCRPVGKKHKVTKAKENAVFTLDNKPALEMLMHDMGISSYKELEKNAHEVFIGLCIPGSDKSDFTIRNLIGIDPDHSLFAINDYLHENDEIIFCNRNSDTAVEDMQLMLDNMKKRLTNTPKGGIYISCLGRGREQFGKDSEEIKMIHQTLGDFPLTGFFANGEIHHNKLYGYTGVLTLFT